MAVFKPFSGHCYQLFSRLRIDQQRSKRVEITQAVFCNETVGGVELPLGV